VRFVQEKAYIVTFVQIDPLFVIDLSDPFRPVILGELKIPGFSDYLHPINATHILGLGRAGDQTGRIRGIKAALFDVSNPIDPVERYAMDLGDWTSESAALDDHKAFLQMDLPKLYNSTLIAFPVTLRGSGGYSCGSSSSSSTKDRDDFQGIKVFRLDEKQFTELASISHESLSEEEGGGLGDSPYDLASNLGKARLCSTCPAAKVRRSLYIKHELFSLSDGYISAHHMANWSLSWFADLHTRKILAPPSDCSLEILQNDLVRNFTERFHYSGTLWDAVATTLTSRKTKSLAECFDQLGCQEKAEVARNYSSQFDESDWGNRSPYTVWNGYEYCRTSLGRQAYQNLGYYAGNCCSLATDEEQETCVEKTKQQQQAPAACADND
jgi:hypothetical protein